MNKDVLLTIYEIVHRDLTKQLNAEYRKIVKCCYDDNTYCNRVCKCSISIKYDHNRYKMFYNYRIFHDGLISIYT